MATIAFCVSFDDTALTVALNFGPSDEATDALTIGATFWKPVTCFGSARTVYFEFVPSGGSVENTSAASSWPPSSSVYAEIPASGTNCTFVSPYDFLYPTRHVLRVLHSGKAPNLKLPTFFRSPIDFKPYFFAVTVVPAECAGRAKAAASNPMTIATPREIANAALAARLVCLRITRSPSCEGRRGH